MLVLSINPILGFLGVLGLALFVAIFTLVLTRNHPEETKAFQARFTRRVSEDGPDVLELLLLTGFLLAASAVVFQPLF